MTLTSIETLDPAKDDAVLGTMDAETLPGMLNIAGGVTGTTFPPGGSGYLFFDVQLDPSAAVPTSVLHHFTMNVASGEGADVDDRVRRRAGEGPQPRPRRWSWRRR